MTTKFHINLAQGILEVEGTEEFVREICTDFKDEMMKLAANKKVEKSVPILMEAEKPTTYTAVETDNDMQQKISSQKTKPKKPSGKKESYTLVPNLQTGMPEEANSIFDYIARYNPKSNIDRNIVFIRYLNEQHSVTTVTADHIYTCYIQSNSKSMPKALYGSLSDTAKVSKGYGFIDMSDVKNIKLVHKGTVRLHEMKQTIDKQKSAA